MGTYTNLAASSACTRCGDLDGSGFHLWTRVGQRVRGRAATLGRGGWFNCTVASCTCVEGARQSDDGACTVYGEGLICPIARDVELQPQLHKMAPPCGAVMTRILDDAQAGRLVCASETANSSISCGECDPNMRWTSEGPCDICEPSDVSVLLIVIFLTTLSLLSVYCAVVNENRAKNHEHMVFLATLSSQLVMVFQMMGVCKLLSVTWLQPYLTILSFASVLNFKQLEILNVSCGGNVRRDSLRCIGLRLRGVSGRHVHFSRLAHVPLPHSRDESRTVEAFPTGSRGRLLSVLATTSAPLLCEAHPYGRSTVTAYPQSSVLVQLGAQAHALGGCCGELHADRISDRGLHRFEAVANVPRAGRHQLPARILQVQGRRVLVRFDAACTQHGYSARSCDKR